MKLAIQESLFDYSDTMKLYERIKNWGFDGVEAWGEGLEDRVSTVRRASEAAGLPVCAICPGLHGIRGNLLSDDAGVRATAAEDIKKLLRCGAELGGAGLNIVPEFGVEKFMKLHPDLDDFKRRKDMFIEQLAPLAAEAQKLSTPILLEPLNRYEAYFLLTVDQAAEICGAFPSGYVRILADFFHMNLEDVCMTGALKQNAVHIGHVHIADSNRRLPGQGHTDFASGLKALAAEGYAGFASMECGITGDPEKDVPESVAYMRRILA